ncbi:MAG TPA: Swt1 family HEPN domain-containing protein [Pyrinomonadaceae bacterium]|nr:Swt1 family HEPN domain-containing protein [Pyrinomonadaceae bacterium]
MNKDPFFNSSMAELLRQEEERRRNFPDYLWAAKLEEVSKINELLKPPHLETHNFLSPSMSWMLEEHSKSLLDFRDTLNKSLLPDVLSVHSAAQSALESLREQMNIHSSAAQTFLESIQFKDLFKVPQFDTSKLFEAASISAFLPSQKDLISSIAALQPSWPSPRITLDSIEGMTGLMSLRNAIVASPFGNLERDALQSLLGRWDSSKLTDSILFEAEARTEFYLDQGFDARLTAFPSSAYNDALFQSGLLRPDLFSPVFPSAEMGYYPLEEDEREVSDDPEVEEERELKARLLKAYDIISNLEIRLREFLIGVMESVFGQSWTKQRVPGEIYKQWKEKRDTALSKGETEQPILWYADFTDYERIITRKDNWKDMFEGKFINMMDVQVSFQRLYPIRNCTMHTRPLTKEDFLLLTVEAQRILRAIGSLDGINEE